MQEVKPITISLVYRRYFSADANHIKPYASNLTPFTSGIVFAQLTWRDSVSDQTWTPVGTPAREEFIENLDLCEVFYKPDCGRKQSAFSSSFVFHHRHL